MSDPNSIPIEQVGRAHRWARRHLDSRDDIANFLMTRGFQAASTVKMDAAHAYFQRAVAEAEATELRAECFLTLGQIYEQANDYLNAERWYKKAVDLPPGTGDTWYLLRNNLAFCLSRSNQHEEAAELCRKAIAIDPNRHNAYKNLGIALEGMKSFVEAAQAFRKANAVCPEDPRALVLLEQLRSAHPEVG